MCCLGQSITVSPNEYRCFVLWFRKSLQTTRRYQSTQFNGMRVAMPIYHIHFVGDAHIQMSRHFVWMAGLSLSRLPQGNSRRSDINRIYISSLTSLSHSRINSQYAWFYACCPAIHLDSLSSLTGSKKASSANQFRIILPNALFSFVCYHSHEGPLFPLESLPSIRPELIFYRTNLSNPIRVLARSPFPSSFILTLFGLLSHTNASRKP